MAELVALIALCLVQEDENNDNSDAAFSRMLASHDQNMAHRARPMDDAEDSFAGKSFAQLHQSVMHCWQSNHGPLSSRLITQHGTHDQFCRPHAHE